jgi:hypothetical protein
MAYDSARDVVVLFGGASLSGRLGDTWEFHPGDSSWVQKTTGPPPATREDHFLAYANARVVMYGGLGASGLLSDCNLWDGSSWSTGDSISPLCQFAMSNDAAGSVIIIFGGCDGTTTKDTNKTWKGNGSDPWEELTFTGAVPPARSFHNMAYDRTRQEYVMYGGFDLYTNKIMREDTWVLK